MAKYQKKLEEDIRCPLEYGLAIFGGKWKSRIICVLSANEKLRYSQIRKEMYKDAIKYGVVRESVLTNRKLREKKDETYCSIKNYIISLQRNQKRNIIKQLKL